MSLASRSNTRLLRRTHAEHHSSLVSSTLRATFALDIPPDASPAFQIEVQGESGYLERPIPVELGGLEWKVRLCLLVAVASDVSREGANGVQLKTLVRDGPSGEWGISWRGAPSIAPLEQIGNTIVVSPPGGLRSWASYLASPFTGVGYPDGDELDEGDEREVDEEWSTVKVETVECEVPIKVWPGNTAFKASDVVFNV
jgi:RAB6A-GEF complex partner protein 2